VTDPFDYLSLLANDADDFELGFPSERWVLAEQVCLSHDAEYVEFVYREYVPGSVARHIATPRRMLLQFVEIAQGSEPADSKRLTGFPLLALDFARRYGALGVVCRACSTARG
jgi:hypothetical protein